MRDLAATIARIERAGDFDTITGLARKVAEARGYDMALVYAIEGGHDLPEDAIYWLEGDWFGTGEAVNPRSYLARCPVNRHVLHSDQPFFWSKRKGPAGEVYHVVTAPRGTGPHGLQVPVFSHQGLVGAVSLGGHAIDTSFDARLVLTMMATAVFHALHRLIRPRTVPAGSRLTPREREVLTWIASGRRQADVAAALGLSERTIENHLRRVRKRLGVASTAQAIHNLTSMGELRG